MRIWLWDMDVPPIYQVPMSVDVDTLWEEESDLLVRYSHAHLVLVPLIQSVGQSTDSLATPLPPPPLSPTDQISYSRFAQLLPN
jgi:hypothetical protein